MVMLKHIVLDDEQTVVPDYFRDKPVNPFCRITFQLPDEKPAGLLTVKLFEDEEVAAVAPGTPLRR